MEFSENTRVKFPAILHLMKLGYRYESISSHNIDPKTNIFIDIFQRSLEKINKKSISDTEIASVIKEIQKISSNSDNGKSFYNRLVKPIDKLKLIDLNDINSNDMVVVTELHFGINEKFRPDIILLINGIPLAFLEVKKPNNIGGIKAEMDRMNLERLPNEEFRKYFNILQVLGFSNNMPYLPIGDVDNNDSVDKTQGSFYGTANGSSMDFNYFREEENFDEFIKYRQLSQEEIEFVLTDNKKPLSLLNNEEFILNCREDSPINSFSNSVFSFTRLFYFLKNGIIYDGFDKHIMRYSQFFASRNIYKRVTKSFDENLSIDEKKSLRRGIVWHTQGSGKTELAAFTSRILQNYFKKKGILGRFYFVVDRLDLLNQASYELGNRGFAITPIKNKADFVKELRKPISTTERQDNSDEISVINIQKIMETDKPLDEIENPYGAKIQRVIFVDEAHRSFKNGGTFFANLMTVDQNAIYIALTGTPIISNKERSTLKFGPYYHTYFYDKSIADGYTLKIKLEPIQTTFKNIIKRNIEIEEGTLESNDIIESENYVNSLAKYIEQDFINFRLLNSDDTLGGMIVAKTSKQAEMIYEWYKNNSSLKTALVLDDTENNKEKQEDFKKTDKDPTFKKYDLLIVLYMLTTGFDVHRLKKMYLLRKADKHGLLQTISRVNRPYTNPNNNYKYNYGYIVDFAGIENNIETTISSYRKELNQDTNIFDYDNIDLSHVITDITEIKKTYDKTLKELKSIIDIDNLEEFSIQLIRFNKETVYKIRKLLDDIKYAYTEFRLSERHDYAKNVNINHIIKLYKETENRIKFLNLLERPVETIKSDFLSNDEIVIMIFEFIKLQSTVLKLSQFIEDDDSNSKDMLNNIISQIKKSKSMKDPRLIKLDEELRNLLKKLLMKESFDKDEFINSLSSISNELEEINNEHECIFGELNDYGYVSCYYECIDAFPDIDKTALIDFLKLCKKSIDEVLVTNRNMYRTKDIFIRTIKYSTSEKLDDAGIYDKLNLMDNFDKLLLKIYNNITLIR